MKSVVVVFPASNCDRDVAVALEEVTGTPAITVWHGESKLPDCDLIVLPGGFSYGDYLRAGAMAAHSPIMRDVLTSAHAGTPVLGICNGFQILTEVGLLPGVLLRNAGLKFICKPVSLDVANNSTMFTHRYVRGQHLTIPIAHHDGNFYADKDTLDHLESNGLVVFRYDENPNGSARNIAGIINQTGTVLGMMPHPERAVDPKINGQDGRPLFESLLEALL